MEQLQRQAYAAELGMDPERIGRRPIGAGLQLRPLQGLSSALWLSADTASQVRASADVRVTTGPTAPRVMPRLRAISPCDRRKVQFNRRIFRSCPIG
jgi:hypothetical protein